MSSFARRRSPAPVWSIDDASTFAAQKEFKLLQLLSTDKKAFATARRLGLNFSHSQPQPHSRSSAAEGAAPPRPPAADAELASAKRNARQQRSAARSARRHNVRRMCNRTMRALLFIVRLRRLVDGTLGLPSGLDDDASMPSDADSNIEGNKRERPSSSASSASTTSSHRQLIHAARVAAGGQRKKAVLSMDGWLPRRQQSQRV